MDSEQRLETGLWNLNESVGWEPECGDSGGDSRQSRREWRLCLKTQKGV